MEVSPLLTPQFFYSLLSAHEKVQHYATDTIKHFDHFLLRRLKRMVQTLCGCNVVVQPAESGLASVKRHCVTFTDISIQRPTIPKTEGVARGLRVLQTDAPPLFPHEALLRGINYSAGIYATVKHEIFSGEGDDEVLEASTLHHNVFFFHMPICVGSSICNLSDPKLASDPVAHKDPNDKGGYFISRGMVKVFQPLKVQRNNILLVRPVVKGSESWIEANIRSIRADTKFRSTSTLNAYLVSSGVITIDIPYLKSNQNIVSAFRLLGYGTAAEIEELVFHNGCADLTPLQMDAARRLLLATIAAPTGQHFLSCTDDELNSLMGAPLPMPSGVVADASRMRRMVMQQVAGELLPHCGFDESAETRAKKALFLGTICRRLILVHMKIEESDDRDFEGYKSLQMCSTTLTMLMRQLMGQFSKTLRKRVFDAVKDGRQVDVDSIILHMDCMPQLAGAFTDGEVTVQKDASNSGKEVIQLVHQVNELSLQSHIGRINTPLPKSGKYPQVRRTARCDSVFHFFDTTFLHAPFSSSLSVVPQHSSKSALYHLPCQDSRGRGCWASSELDHHVQCPTPTGNGRFDPAPHVIAWDEETLRS